MNNIELYSEKLPSLLREVDSFPDLQVGNFLIKKNANSYNAIAEIISIDIVKKKKWTKEGWVDTEEDTVEIKVQYYDLSLNKRGNVTLLDSGFKEKEAVKFNSKEIPFIKMLAAEGYDEEDIKEGIKWWKNKGKFKRFIHTDDAKAYRMIKKYCDKLYT